MSGQQDKKKQILDAATKVFAEKGFHQARISDLARAGGFGEATIYNHFTNKEEILLTLPHECIPDLVSRIEDHLTGLINPEEKLRRFIWVYTWWGQNQPEFMRVLLLEIQRQPAYYRSSGYELISGITRRPADMLREGQEQGLFRPEIDPWAFSCFLLGTLNYLFMNRMTFDRSLNLLDYFDAVAGMVLAAVKIPVAEETNHLENEDRRKRILAAGERIFSEKPFQETRISEIAALAQVADGTIYDYFKGKEDLLFAIFEQRMAEFTASYDDVLAPARAEVKLYHVLWHFFKWAKANRTWARIYFKDLIPNPRFYQSPSHQVMQAHDEKVKVLLREGLESGAFNSELTPSLFRAFIFGTIDELLTPWLMLERPFDLAETVNAAHDLISRAMLSA